MKITPELLTKAYTRGIQSALKGLATDGSDLHENYTPPVICDMMLDKLDLTQPKSILVLYNLELLFALRLRKYTGPVTFFTQSPTKAEIAPKFLPGVAVEYIDKEENPLYFMENKWPEKFDIVVANPPYSKKLDLKFLDKAFDVAKEEVVFVHPSTSFVDTKESTSIYKEINSKISGSLESLTLFNGNGIFGIVLLVPCCITHLVKNRVSGNFKLENLTQNRVDFCESLEQVSLFGNRKEFFKFSEKTNFEKNLHTCGTVLGSRQEHKRVLKSPNAFFVETTHISGHANAGESVTKESNQQRNDFFVILNKPALQIKRGINPKYNLFWEFETEKEAQNFIEYCKTDFARACLAKTKINQHLYNGELKAIPWMDFTQEWTDEKLYAHFGITEEEQAFIKEVIPPYYD